MRGNQFGKVFCVTTFGESHGPAMGAVIDGCPAGVVWQQEMLTRFLERRRPARTEFDSQRAEPDQVEILSGVWESKTLGTPIAAVIRNVDQRSQDYSAQKLETRQGHATDLWQDKYGHADWRGSGRASGRETVSRVIGGAVARMFVSQLYPELQVIVFVSRIGPSGLSDADCIDAAEALESDPWHVDDFSLRCPSLEKSEQMGILLREARAEGESYGGEAFVRIAGLPKGLGQPVFGKIKAQLAEAYLGVGATIGVEIGQGFEGATLRGKEFHGPQQDYGGIRGGLTTGDPVSMKVAFKPTSTRGEMAVSGRHDPCIVPRAVPVLEAMTWLTLADQILLSRLDHV